MYVEGIVIRYRRQAQGLHSRWRAGRARVCGASTARSSTTKHGGRRQAGQADLVPAEREAEDKGETVWFAWILYRNRKSRDAVMKKVMKDPRLADMMDPKEDALRTRKAHVLWAASRSWSTPKKEGEAKMAATEDRAFHHLARVRASRDKVWKAWTEGRGASSTGGARKGFAGEPSSRSRPAPGRRDALTACACPTATRCGASSCTGKSRRPSAWCSSTRSFSMPKGGVTRHTMSPQLAARRCSPSSRSRTPGPARPRSR